MKKKESSDIYEPQSWGLSPEEIEKLGDRLQQFWIPEFGAPCQQDKPEAVAICELRSFDLSLKDNQLLPKESIFNYQIGLFTA
jgi:hypothetical protein